MLSISITELADTIGHCLWTREPYRHFQVETTVKNDGPTAEEQVSFELLVPENAIFNLSGDAWNPIYKREVEGTVYDAWQTLGGGALKYEAVIGGIKLPPGVWQQKLTVNLKLSLSKVELLSQVFQRGDAIGSYDRQSFDLRPYRPGV